MRFSQWFENWDWLKDSNNEWNYARIVGMICILFIQPTLLFFIYFRKDLSDIVNVWQWLLICMPSITAIALFIIEIFRDKNVFRLKLGDKSYEINSTKDTEK